MIHLLESLYRNLLRKFSVNEWMVRLLGFTIDEPTAAGKNGDISESDRRQRSHGLVMVQIDGLGQTELNRALAKGELPFLSKLLKSEHYQINPLYSGLPSSTPAVQGELFYGVKGVVPAFAFVDRSNGQLNRMYDSDNASRVEAVLRNSGEPLLRGGSAYCNIYTGGAAEPHFCAASLGWGDLLRGIKPLAWLSIAILNFPTVIRMMALLLIELALGIADFVGGLIKGQHFGPEFKFIFSRIAISIALRDLITMGAKVDIARGLPIIHLNYLGYDEQAHRRGPSSTFAHWTLRGIDRSIERLWRTCHETRYRHYDLWIYSDHGQEATIPYESYTGKSIEDAVKRACADLPAGYGEESRVVAERMQHQRARLLGGKNVQKIFPHISIDWKSETNAPPLVVAMGPVGHVYLHRKTDIDNLNMVANQLVQNEGIPTALYLNRDKAVVALRADELYNLPTNAEALFGKSHPYLDEVTADLIALCQHQDAGDIVILGWSKTSPPLSFPDENGSHAGPGPLETAAFALLPADTVLPHTHIGKNGSSILRPLDLRQAALHVMGRGEVTSNLPAKIDTVDSETTLKVMTYNVHSCIGMDSKISPERIARVIARYQPDIVALQELDVRKFRSNHADQAEIIASLLEMSYHFHPTMHVEEEKYGDAILTHLPMRFRQAAALPMHPSRPNCEPRGALWATVEFNGIELQVFNTHLGLYAAERRAQVEELTGPAWLGHPDCTGPVIFCGDLNALPGSPAMKSLKTKLADVQTANKKYKPKNTFTGRLPTLRIDHILTSNIARVDRVEVPDTTLTRIASDHLPLIVDLVIN